MQDYWRMRPRAPAPGTLLCTLAEIAIGTTREFIFGAGPSAFRMLIVRTSDGNVHAYLNLCPHFSLPLNHQPDAFLDPTGTALQCSQHFALFRLEDGSCISGACEGSSLDRIPIAVVQDMIRIAG